MEDNQKKWAYLTWLGEWLYDPATKVKSSRWHEHESGFLSFQNKTDVGASPAAFSFKEMKDNRIAHSNIWAEITICCSSYEIRRPHNLTTNHDMALYNKIFMMFLLLRVCHLGKKSLTKKN
jgi:hypothetical protein